MVSGFNVVALVCWCVAGYSGFKLACSLYLLRRARWVFNQRMKVLDRSVDDYISLPPYLYMVQARWWVWKFEEFQRGGKHNRRSPNHEFGSSDNGSII